MSEQSPISPTPTPAHMTPGDAPATAPKPEAPEWLPCPLCGEALITHNPDMTVQHTASDDCPLDCMFLYPEHRAAWNRRAPKPEAYEDDVTLWERIASLICGRKSIDADELRDMLQHHGHPAPQSDEAATLRAQLAEAEAALQAEKDHADRLHSALAVLKNIVGVARNDDEVDSWTQAGCWLCGDVMSDAYEDAVTALAAHQARRAGE